MSLCDYTGQNTATVGILDAFYDSKGLIAPQEFRKFCNSVVPLFKAKRLYKNTECLEAELDLYDYGREPITQPVFRLVIHHGNTVFCKLDTTNRNVSIPLKGITESALLKVTLSVNGYENRWNVYVFAEDEENRKTEETGVRLICSYKELQQIAETGGRALLTPDCLDDSLEGSFIPVFWSPVFFPSQKPCGAMIDESHPLFAEFPTEQYPDYQWKKLLERAKCVDISEFPEDFHPIVETVPNYVDNTPGSPLWEARIGRAEVMFCGFDLSEQAVEVQAFKRALYSYLCSDSFRPECEIILDNITQMPG